MSSTSTQSIKTHKRLRPRAWTFVTGVCFSTLGENVALCAFRYIVVIYRQANAQVSRKGGKHDKCGASQENPMTSSTDRRLSLRSDGLTELGVDVTENQERCTSSPTVWKHSRSGDRKNERRKTLHLWVEEMMSNPPLPQPLRYYRNTHSHRHARVCVCVVT